MLDISFRQIVKAVAPKLLAAVLLVVFVVTITYLLDGTPINFDFDYCWF